MDLAHLKTIKVAEARYPCVFCRSSEVDEVNLGPLYLAEGVVTHYFCMLFSAGLSQNGNDKEGVLGFLPVDIMKEVRRAQRLKCSYCSTIGASVGCCTKRCKVAFHFPCGLTHGANFQFYGNFESYCINHAKVQVTRPPVVVEEECPICFSNIEDEKPIKGTCCNSATFHKECIQKVALSAGYFFKCPTCNDTKDFTQEMRSQGIFVPEQDAAWEREPNAYQDLLYQYSHCDAEVCECSKGREYGAAKGSWLLARCRICGAAGTHRQCGKLTTIANWACGPCLEVETRTETEKKTAKPKKSEKPSKVNTTPATQTQVQRQTMSSKESKAASSVKKETDKKITLLDDEEVNLNRLMIMPSCRDYFPHSKAAIQRFAKRKKVIMPDWRMLELRVSIIDFLSDDVEATLPGEAESTSASTAVIAENSNPVVKKIVQKKSVTRKDRKTSTERRPYRRVSRWNRGVISKKKASKSKASKSKASEAVSEENVEPPSQRNQANVDEMLAQPCSSKSVAILEGIRSSESALRRWMLQPIESEAIDETTPSEKAKVSCNDKNEIGSDSKKRRNEDIAERNDKLKRSYVSGQEQSPVIAPPENFETSPIKISQQDNLMESHNSSILHEASEDSMPGSVCLNSEQDSSQDAPYVVVSESVFKEGEFEASFRTTFSEQVLKTEQMLYVYEDVSETQQNGLSEMNLNDADVNKQSDFSKDYLHESTSHIHNNLNSSDKLDEPDNVNCIEAKHSNCTIPVTANLVITQNE